jgi:hypothetical protein
MRETEVRYVNDRSSYRKKGIQHMKNIPGNVLAALAGIVVGSLVNVGLVNVGPLVVPLPEGADVSTVEGVMGRMGEQELAAFFREADTCGAFRIATVVPRRSQKVVFPGRVVPGKACGPAQRYASLR